MSDNAKKEKTARELEDEHLFDPDSRPKTSFEEFKALDQRIGERMHQQEMESDQDLARASARVVAKREAREAAQKSKQAQTNIVVGASVNPVPSHTEKEILFSTEYPTAKFSRPYPSALLMSGVKSEVLFAGASEAVVMWKTPDITKQQGTHFQLNISVDIIPVLEEFERREAK